jgi:hypothetical protein
MADQQWTDLYLRHTFQDTGIYPTAGTLSSSPDVIPLGGSPVSDPQQLITDDNWTKDYGSSTNASEPNYIYLRGRNLGEAQTEGRLYLYYSPASLLLWPTDPLDPAKGWANHPLKTSFGEEFQTVRPAAGERFVTAEGFRWIPEPISNDHYCLVGRISTDANPNPIPAVGTLTDFATYISTHPDMAWRNVTTINPANPVSTAIVNYSQGSQGGETYLILRCENAPNGSEVKFSSGTPGPNPMVEMKGTVQNTGSQYTLSLLTDIPANWTSDIAYTWYSKGLVPLPGMKIWLDAVLPVAEDDPVLGRFAEPLTSLGVSAHTIPHAGPRKGIRLGSSLMQTLPVATNAGRRVTRVGGAGQDAPSVLFSGVAWGERRSSVFGSRTTNLDVAVARSVVSEVEVETVTLTESQAAPPVPDASDVSVDAVLSSGPYTGTVFASLIATNVPVGCEIWFHSLDGSVPIAVAPTRVTSATKFTVTAFADGVPAEYAATVRSSLRLNGHDLPAAAELKFSCYEVLPEERGAAAPKPGKLLGSVTLKP